MFKKLKNHIINLPLKTKLLSTTIIVNIFLVGIISVIGLNVVTSANNKLLYKSIANTLSYSALDIETVLSTVETMSNIIITDNSIQTNLSIIKNSDNTMARSNSYKTLYNSIQKYFFQLKPNHTAYISLYNDYFTTHSYALLANKTPDFVTKDIIDQAMIKEGSAIWTTKYSDDYGLFLSRSIREIKNFNMDNMGTLTICLDIDKLIKETTNFSNQYEESSYLLFDKNELVYRSSSLSDYDAQNIQTKLPANYGIINLDGNKYFGVRGSISKYGWDYICLVSYDATYRSIMFTYGIYILLMLLSIILSIVLLKVLFKLLIIHFDTLILKMKLFRGQDSQLIDVGYNYQDRGDELGLLHRHFDSMASEIQELIKVDYINKLLIKDAQLKALESQINPHFLYNTLESINWRAKAIGEKQISSMVESLGQLLRITLNPKEDHFTLQQEIEFVQHYITIQQIRFEEKLHCELTIDKSILNTYIPKLTIQPLVENAIHYALEEITEHCIIHIIIELHGKNLLIYVKNSGSQFEPDILEKLSSQKIQPHRFGIGLLNINNRLKLTFGDDYGLSFYNENETAVALITIPYQPLI